ncbi:MAG: hypothetical protein KAR62_04335 [Sphingomonadales bacterium]|nr:hypothetical protein [Sphingomonadales bacterium]
MYKKFLFALITCLFLQPSYLMAQSDEGTSGSETTETTTGSGAQSQARPAGMHASLVANRSGGYGLATKVVVAGLVVGGLAAVILETATDGSKISDLPSGTILIPTTTTTTTTATTSSSTSSN